MLVEAHYRTVLNFFFFQLSDEQMAVSASVKAIRRFRSRSKGLSTEAQELLLIDSMSKVLSQLKGHRHAVLHVSPRSDWSVKRTDYLLAWREFSRKVGTEVSEILVLRYLLRYDIAQISQALGVPEGTLLYRLGRGLESFSQTPTLVAAMRN